VRLVVGKGLLIGKGGIAAPSPQSTRALCQVRGQRQEQGAGGGGRLSTGIGVHILGATPLKLLAEVA